MLFGKNETRESQKHYLLKKTHVIPKPMKLNLLITNSKLVFILIEKVNLRV